MERRQSERGKLRLELGTKGLYGLEMLVLHRTMLKITIPQDTRSDISRYDERWGRINLLTNRAKQI